MKFVTETQRVLYDVGSKIKSRLQKAKENIWALERQREKWYEAEEGCITRGFLTSTFHKIYRV